MSIGGIRTNWSRSRWDTLELVHTILGLTIHPQMSDMANNDLEKYAKALDKYETCFIV